MRRISSSWSGERNVWISTTSKSIRAWERKKKSLKSRPRVASHHTHRFALILVTGVGCHTEVRSTLAPLESHEAVYKAPLLALHRILFPLDIFVCRVLSFIFIPRETVTTGTTFPLKTAADVTGPLFVLCPPQPLLPLAVHDLSPVDLCRQYLPPTKTSLTDPPYYHNHRQIAPTPPRVLSVVNMFWGCGILKMISLPSPDLPCTPPHLTPLQLLESHCVFCSPPWFLSVFWYFCCIFLLSKAVVWVDE